MRLYIVKGCSASELLPILRDSSDLVESIFYNDCWVAYYGLVDYGVKAHYRVKHSKNEFALGRNHINGIEIFLLHQCSQLQAERDMPNIDWLNSKESKKENFYASSKRNFNLGIM